VTGSFDFSTEFTGAIAMRWGDKASGPNAAAAGELVPFSHLLGSCTARARKLSETGACEPYSVVDGSFTITNPFDSTKMAKVPYSLKVQLLGAVESAGAVPSGSIDGFLNFSAGIKIALDTSAATDAFTYAETWADVDWD